MIIVATVSVECKIKNKKINKNEFKRKANKQLFKLSWYNATHKQI